jgi:hypothetical protein
MAGPSDNQGTLPLMQRPAPTKQQGANRSWELVRQRGRNKTHSCTEASEPNQQLRCARIILTVQPSAELSGVCPGEAPMFEVIVALLTIFSIGIFTAHAVDAVKS